MSFEWDEEKNLENKRKHGISFEEAKQIFDGPVITKDDDRFSYGEERSISLGLIKSAAVVLVAHTDRKNNIRIISARYATKTERKVYNEKLKEITTEQFFEGPKGPRH